MTIDDQTASRPDAPDLPRPEFERYVAIGDSSTEGLVDPDGAGGYRGWSMRLAERIAQVQGQLEYANLAIRGLRTRQILDTQLAPALAMRPDLVTVFSGTNDVVARRFDPDAVAEDMARMQRAFVAAGATVLTFTLPDLAPVLPLARPLSPRVNALNQGLRRAAAASGAILVDFAATDIGADPRLWSADRFHANPAGHARIAAALGHALALPGSDATWRDALPAAAPRSAAARLATELGWMARFMVPWLAGSLLPLGPRTPRLPKRPTLAPMVPRSIG